MAPHHQDYEFFAFQRGQSFHDRHPTAVALEEIPTSEQIRATALWGWGGERALLCLLHDAGSKALGDQRTAGGDDGLADLESERILMEVPQPYWNHNSGNIAFGPDGMLYIALGDGGKGNDERGLAQNPFLLNGKILRIDVDSKSGAREYGIPEDNPFTDEKKFEGYRPEIWATGLRNPWGLWFDPADGRLWCADVGQNLWEEVNIIEKVKNYGWSHREGAVAFALRTDEPAEGTEFAEPLHVYDHTVGLSISGGYVYQGDRLGALKGHYLYSDFVKGWVGSFSADDGGQKPMIFHERKDPKGSFMTRIAGWWFLRTILV